MLRGLRRLEPLQPGPRLFRGRILATLKMAQFDIHENKGANHAAIPYVVVVQSALYDDFRLRVVVPLVRKSVVGRVDRARFNPEFRIRGTNVILHPLEVSSVQVDRLGEAIGSLAGDGQRIPIPARYATKPQAAKRIFVA